MFSRVSTFVYTGRVVREAVRSAAAGTSRRWRKEFLSRVYVGTARTEGKKGRKGESTNSELKK